MQPFKGCLKNLKLNKGFQPPAEQVGISKGCPESSLVGLSLSSYSCQAWNSCGSRGTFLPLRSSVKQSSTSRAPCRPTSNASAWITMSLYPWDSRARRTGVSSCRTNSWSGLLFALKVLNCDRDQHHHLKMCFIIMHCRPMG